MGRTQNNESSSESIVEDVRNLNERAKTLMLEWGSEGCDRLLECIGQYKVEFTKTHPKKKMLRKDIDWQRVSELLQDQGEICQSDVIRKVFILICGHIRIERKLESILKDASLYTQRISKPRLTNMYRVFTQKLTRKIKKKNPQASMPQIASLASEKWKNLSDRKKKRYADKADAINEKIRRENPDHSFSKSKRKPTLKLSFDPDIKIPPPNIFSYYCSQFNETEGFKNGNQRRNLARVRWDSLSPDEMNRYCQEYKEIKKKFDSYLGTLSPSKREEYEAFIEQKKRPKKIRV